VTVMQAESGVAREENRRRLEEDLQARRTATRSLPATVRIETHDGCGARCGQCFGSTEHVQSTLSPSLYDRLAQELFARIEVLQLGHLNEPLHDPHFRSRLERVDPDDGPELHLFTSGDGLDRWTSLVLERVRRLVIAATPAGPSGDSREEAGRSWERMLRSVERVRATASQASEARVRLHFNVRIDESDGHRLPSTVARLAAAGADRVFITSRPAWETSRPGMTATLDELRDHLHRACLQGDLSGVAVICAPVESFRHDGAPALPADAPWRLAAVNAEGSLGVCCPQGGLTGVVNVGSVGFRAAWNAPQLQDIRRADQPMAACGRWAWSGGVLHG